MKTRTLISILILVLAVLIIVGSCATKKMAISTEDAMNIRSGRWVNETYAWGEQLVVYHINGEYEVYDTPQQLKPIVTGTSNIYESWRDSERGLWYRAHFQDSLGTEGYQLGKISNKDKTLEYLYTANNVVIDEWNRNKGGYGYIIYYRQE